MVGKGFLLYASNKAEVIVVVRKHWVRNMTIKYTYGKSGAGGT